MKKIFRLFFPVLTFAILSVVQSCNVLDSDDNDDEALMQAYLLALSKSSAKNSDEASNLSETSDSNSSTNSENSGEASEDENSNPLKVKFNQDCAVFVAPYNQPVEISCAAEISGDSKGSFSYQWYESADETTSSGKAIEGATSETLTVPATTEKGFRYYYCAATFLPSSENASNAESASAVSDIATVACTGLATVVIDTVDNSTPTTAKEKNYGRCQVFYPDGNKYDSDKYEQNGFSIKVRGNATAGYPKKPYKLKLPEKKNLIDINSDENNDKNWVLLANYCDKTLLRSKIGFYTASLFNEISGNENLYVPHSRFVDVVLNGEYLGNYTLTDSVKEGDDRVPVNRKATKKNGGIGFVSEYDPNYYANESKYFITKLMSCPYTFKFPDSEDDLDSHMDYFEDYMNKFENALYDEKSTDDWKNYIDIESFARWFLIHNILANIDTNYFVSKKTSDENSKLVMGPVWDFEWSIGIGWYDGDRPRNPDYWCVDGWYFGELLKKSNFISEIQSQWEKLTVSYPNLAETINAKMDEYASEIEISQKINFVKWNILNQKVSVGGKPLGSYAAELECDKQFMQSRISWLSSAIGAL